MPTVALLVLEDGSVHLGAPFGAEGIAQGPADFCVEMNGEHKALTSLDHAGKILVMTSPHVGISGFDPEAEPTRITATGLVIREGARPASWTRRRELVEELKDQGVVGISGIDTRAVTHRLRANPTMRALIVSGRALPASAQVLVDRGVRRLSLDDAAAQLFPQGVEETGATPLFDSFLSQVTSKWASIADSEGRSL